MNYYYLIASLPSLTLDAEAPLAPATLRTLAAEHLEPQDLAEFDAVLHGGGRSAFARAWLAFDTQVRNGIAKVRAARLNVDVAPFLRPVDGFDLTLTQQIQSAMTASDPLARERALDALRWRWLDDTVLSAPFSFDAVLAYALKLDMTARGATRTDAQGRARLTQQVDAMLHQFDRR